jgi:hypothetical protein
MKFAYADPPYFGCGKLYADRHPDALAWDKPETHQALIDRLSAEFDGWALSTGSVQLRTILPMCPDNCHIGAWVKPFCNFKPNVGFAYAWEPVIFRGGRKITRDQDSVRDWVSANITLKRGLVGAKPRDFCLWLFQCLNIFPTDEFVDLFPGSNAVGAAWAEWCDDQSRLPQLPLMAAATN